MKRKLSEKQAWLKIAAAWDKATDPGDGICTVFNGDTGLCPTICVWKISTISEDTYRSMMDKIMRLPSVTRMCHKWPMSAKGAKARAAWCRKQAKLLERKAKVKR